MSTAFRITQRSVAQTAMHGLQGNLSRMQRLQEQLSSGRVLNRPSDSPVGTGHAMQLRGDAARTEQYARNADDGLGWLGTADSVLIRSLDMVRKARDVTVSGMSGAISPAAREAMALEVESLREGLINVANTRYLDRPLFAGTQRGADETTDVAYDDSGQYLGNGVKLERTVAPGTKVQVAVTGPDVFGQDGEETQLFAVLDRIADHLRTDAAGGSGQVDMAALTKDLGDLDTAMNRMINTAGEVGARYNRVETMRDKAKDQLLTSTNRLSEVESTDLAKTIVDLQMQEVAYQAALGATARAIQPSLVDFLR